MDAGCGWGVTLDSLEKDGYDAIGLDQSRRALERIDRPDRSLVEADLNQPMPQGVSSFDAVLALDVIEHLDDDRTAVRRLGSLLRPGGFLVVSVPALPELFGEFDAVQGHRRRYLPETLRGVFAGSELRLERVFWWGQFLVPTLRRMRTVKRGQPGEPSSSVYARYLKLPPWPLPLVASLAFRLEEGPCLRGRATIGTSLFAVAQRGSGATRLAGTTRGGPD
jgi:SAM-dependent methyltransferase